MSFLYNLEGSLLAPDRSYQPRYINVIANVSRIRISNSPSANAETPPFAAAVARNAGRSARKNMSFRMAVHPEPSSFLPFLSLAHVIPLSNILILFIGFSSFLFSDVKLISFPEKFRLEGLNKRTKLRFDRARIFVLFRTEFWSNYR